jgi:hypothetical protein
MATTFHRCPFLCDEGRDLRAGLARTRTVYANLLAAARCAVAAAEEGEPDPLYYLRDELSTHDYQSRSDGAA